MLGASRTLRDRSSSRDPDAVPPSQGKARTTTTTKDKGKVKAEMGSWTEPSLADKPSYRDQGSGSHYGVADHMQPLGEAPNARVKTRVKADGARKSVLGRSAAAIGLDAQETPEGTPAPPSTLRNDVNSSPPPRIVVDDGDDADYAPNGTGKKKERATRARAAKRQSDVPPASPTKKTTQAKASPPPPKMKRYDAPRVEKIVEEAKRRAVEVGKPDLAAAVHEIHLQSHHNERLLELLQAILMQNATPEQTVEFQDHVRLAKKKLKGERALKGKDNSRDLPESSNGTQSLPLRSPSKFTPVDSETSAIPSTEPTDPSKPKTSSKGKSLAKDSNRRRSGHSATMSASPAKDRSGSPDSDSSLTDLTSNPDEDMDVDEPDADGPSGLSASINAAAAKDHAAERGSLAPPSRNLKRSSADADIEEQERDRALASKKQKFNETITRDYKYEESNVRGPPNSTASRLRSRQGKAGALAPPPSLSITTNGGRNAGGRGSRALSSDLDSPLSERTTPSLQGTPRTLKAPAKPFGKRAKTKQSPEKKHVAAVSGMPGGGGGGGAGGAGRESPVGDDDNEELSENNDFCSSCGGSGFLLCCDGCDRSFHFSCLDPPLNDEASELNEPWYCYVCIAKRPITAESPEKRQRGLFAPLFSSLRKRNPSNFALPQDIRDYFEGVAADRTGSFIEAVHTRTRNRPGYSDEQPDFTKLKDPKGNTILCYSCGKSSGGTRSVIPCDYCGLYWHLDCLDPPLSNPPARSQEGKKAHDWMCPLHADHELRKVDTSLLNPRNLGGRKVHMRKPRNAKVVETSLRRGFRNNGVVDVVEDESEDSGSEFFDDDTHDEGVVYRLPASGIKLDFIDKVKTTRVQDLRSRRALHKAQAAPRQMDQANFARRSFLEKQMALNLAQFADANNDLQLGGDQVENLLGTLIAEAPTEVVQEMMAAEDADALKARSAGVPPSPPSSEQTDPLSAEQRRELQALQELIRRRLEGSKTF